jgi:hypothetical protein
MGGALQTFANLGNRVSVTLALEPIDWGCRATDPFASAVVFEDGVLMTVTRRDGRVLVNASTEAGAMMLVNLEPNDAMTAALLCAAEGA